MLRTLSRSWVTSTIVRPSLRNSTNFSRHRFWNVTSPTASTSSMISSRGSTLIATENARRTYMPDEYVFTGWSMNVSSPEKATISSKRAAMSRRPMPRIAALRNTFSRPVSSGWKPAPELEQRRHPPMDVHRALVRLEDAGHALQQRRLARAVVADDAEDLALGARRTSRPRGR